MISNKAVAVSATNVAANVESAANANAANTAGDATAAGDASTAQNNAANLSTYTSQSSDELNFVLIDPVKAMASLSKMTGDSRHAFLVNKNGKVLAHSVNAFVGTDLTKMDSLKGTIEGLFLGAQTGTVTHYQAMDGGREQIAFVRAGALPFAIGVEQKSNAPILSLGWLAEEFNSGAARKNLGIILIMIASALALFSGVSIWLSKELQKQIGQNAAAREETAIENNSYFTPSERAYTPVANVNATTNASPYQNSATQKPFATPSYANDQASVNLAGDSLAEAAKNFVETRANLTQELQQSQSAARTLANFRATRLRGGVYRKRTKILHARNHRKRIGTSQFRAFGKSGFIFSLSPPESKFNFIVGSGPSADSQLYLDASLCTQRHRNPNREPRERRQSRIDYQLWADEQDHDFESECGAL
jgi:hypothetical protein